MTTEKHRAYSFTVSVREMDRARQAVDRASDDCGLGKGDRNLVNLLFEELSVSMRENLPQDNKVRIRIRNGQGGFSVTVRTSSDTDFLKNGSQSAQDENDEIERRLRSEVLASNSDRFFSRFNERKHRIVITINAGKNKARRDFEEELEVFYDGFRDNPPTPMAQMRFLLRQRKWAFLISFLIKIGRSLPMIVIPIISANIIDIVQAGSLEGNLTAFLVNLGAGILSLVLHILFVYLDAAYFQELCRTIGENLRNVMVRKLQLLAMSFHDEAHAGAIANKILNSVDAIESTIRMFATQMATILVYCIAAIVVTLLKCPLMSLFYVLFIPLALVMASVFRKPIRRQNRELRTAMEDTSSAVTEMLDMVGITRAHGLQKDEVSRMSHHMGSIHDSGRRLDITNEVFGATSWIALQVFQLFALAFSAFLAGRGIISIGMIALFQSYFSATVTRLSTFINIIPQFTKGLDACTSIAEVLCADNCEQRGTAVPAPFNGEVRFSDVGFSYKDTQVLRNLDLEIPARSSLAIVGGSGSGKSTVLKLLLGFILPAEGQVSVDGTDMREMDLSRYRKHLAVVPQHSMLFSGTLLQNLMYGAPPYVSRSRVWEVVRQVGLEDFVNSLPEGLDSPISESGSNLSGGQSQRISIARALLRDPRILVLDEPTSALDSKNEQKVLEILDDIMGTCTVIMVAHRLNTVRNFDSIAVLENGRVAEKGTYDELVAKNGLFCRILKEKD